MKRQRVSAEREEDVYSGGGGDEDEGGRRAVPTPVPTKRATLPSAAAVVEAAVMFETSEELSRKIALLNHLAYRTFLKLMKGDLSFRSMDAAISALHAYAQTADCRLRIRTSRLKGGRPTKVVVCCVKGCPFQVTVRNTSVTVTDIDVSSVSRFRHAHPVAAPLGAREVNLEEDDGLSRLIKRVDWETFVEWLSGCPPGTVADVLRQAWVSERPLEPLNGMMGDLFKDDVQVMQDAYEWTRYCKAISRSIKVHRVSKPVTHYNGAPTKYGRGLENVLFETVVMTTKTAFEEAIGPHETPYFQWWYERTNCVRGEDGLLALLHVKGLDALDLQKTLLLLQRNHDVFNNDQSDPRNGGDGHQRHTIFPPALASLDGSPSCYMAINKYALRAIRLTMLRYIPVECKFPSAPLLIQGWATKPDSPYEDAVRRQGVAAVVGFIAQHVHRGKCGSYAGGSSVSGNRRCTCVHSHTTPQFALYEGLPLFVSYLRCQKDAILLERIRDSQPGGKYEDAGDSLYKLLAAFVFQKKEHFILKKALQTMWGRFENGDNCVSLRAKYPIAYALIAFLKNSPAMGSSAELWVPIYLPSWGSLSLSKLLPPNVKLPDSSYAPHHFFYELCFDEQNFDLEFRTMLATQMIINHPPSPAINEAADKLADFWFREELRDYEAKLARPVHQLPLQIAKPHTKDLWPLNGLYLLLSSMQHVAWNPGCLHTGDAGELRSPVRIADPALFACKQLDLPVAYERFKGEKQRCKVYYMENFLLAWTGTYSDASAKGKRDALYAYNLVRDEQFYADRVPLMASVGDDDDEERDLDHLF